MSGGGEDVRNPRPPTLADAEAIAASPQTTAIRMVAPVLQSQGTVSYRGESVMTSIVAVTPEYAVLRSLTIAGGSGISADHVRLRQAVAVLGSDVAQSLFGTTDGLAGKTIVVQNQVFRVIGVLESMGGSAMGSDDDQILVPLTTAQSRLTQRATRDQVDLIYTQAVSADQMDLAVDQLTRVLAARHKVSASEPDFNVLNQQDILDVTQSITGIFTLFLGGIAGISLLVGGIGIMNIMFVTVSERTHEIGLRKAIGARKFDIMIQFLTESSLLSMFGGILGIGLGWTIAYIVGLIAAANNTELIPVVGLDAILLATIFSTAVGLFFGIYPANRAANLQPVEALRHE